MTKFLRIRGHKGVGQYFLGGVSAIALGVFASPVYADGLNLVVADVATASTASTATAADTGAPGRADAPVLLADASTTDTSATGGIETVVVSARLRKENQQDVPVALEAISGDVLDRDNTDALTSLQIKAPSISIVQGNPRQASVSIRGIGLTGSDDGQDASTGIFIDGVYQARPGQASFDYEDIAQIEVLRGPQGTLFGRNTTSGALVVETRAPSFDYGVGVEADGGNYGLVQLKGYITNGITDDLAFRLSAWSTKQDGFVRDTFNGQSYGGRGDLGVRGQLLYQPSENFRYRLIYSYEQQDFSGVPSIITGVVPVKGTALNLYQRLNLAIPGYIPPSNPYGHITDTNNYFDNIGYKHTLTGNGDLTLDGGYTISSITNLTFWRYNPYNDNDGTQLDGIHQFGAGNTNLQYSQEFRVASPSDQAVEWVAGAIYFHSRVAYDLGQVGGAQDGYFTPQLSTANLALLTPANRNFSTLATVLNGGLNGWSANQQATPTIDSGAFFGQGTWKVTDRLSFTLGLRASYDYRWEHQTQTNSAATPGYRLDSLHDHEANVLNGGLSQAQFLTQYGSYFLTSAGAISLLNTSRGVAPATNYASSSLWNGSGTTSLSYKIDDGVMAYATFSRGYKSAATTTKIQPAGLPQVAPPEIILDYEAGVKTTLLNDRLTLNANLFWENYKDYQANISGDNAITGLSASFLGSISKIVSRGVETDITWLPIENLRVDASASYDEAYFGSFTNAPCSVEASVAGLTVCNLSGRPLPYAPKWIGNVSAEYTVPLDGGNQLYAVGTYSYRSGSYLSTDFTDSKYSWGTGYGLTNLRIGTRVGDHWDVSIFSNNFFNTNYATAKAASTTLYNTSVSPGFPRTYGITARFQL